jgi:methyl-accepting chemotaxis protein
MPTPAESVGYRARITGSETRVPSTRSSTRAALQPSSQPLPAQPSSSKAAATAKPKPTRAKMPESDTTGERVFAVCKEIIMTFHDITDTLDDILTECTTVAQFTKTVTILAKYTRQAAEYKYDSHIQLADIKTVKKEITSNLTKWCQSIENKIDSLGGKQNKILEETAKLSDKANGLHTVTKELKNQIEKVTVASDKIASNATPY